MSIYLQVDSSEPHQIASNLGWSNVLRWVQTLPNSLVDLINLCEWGWCQNLKGLQSNIETAIQEHEPPPDVKVTLESLRDFPDEGSQVLIVTNGTIIEPAASADD